MKPLRAKDQPSISSASVPIVPVATHPINTTLIFTKLREQAVHLRDISAQLDKLQNRIDSALNQLKNK